MKLLKPKSLQIKNILFTHYKTDKFTKEYLDKGGKKCEKDLSKLY